MSDRLSILRAIRNADPDGGEFEPTDNDYRRFETWVTTTYGADFYREYMTGQWEPTPEV